MSLKKMLGETRYRLILVAKKILPVFAQNFLRNLFSKYYALMFDLRLLGTKIRNRYTEDQVVISVVIPVYDRTVELKESIDSILGQTFKNFELILVTDGSPKETLAIVHDYKDNSKVRIFEYPDNSGTSVRGRNKGILEARGKYLAFLDSDDIAFPNRLSDTVALFEQTDTDVVYGAFEFMVDGSRKIDEVANGQVVLPQKFTADELAKANPLFNSASAVRTEFVRKAGGLKTKMRYCEDYELWLRMMRAGAKFEPLAKTLIKYRVHSGNLELEFKKDEEKWLEFARKESLNAQKLPTKVAFVIPTTGIGGGIAVVCEYANRLQKRGYDVTLINDPQYKDKYDLSWFPGQNVPLIGFKDAVSEYDVLIATGWTTAHTLKAIKAKRKIYFIQSDERRFGNNKSTVDRIEKTYRMDYEFITEAKWIKKWLKQEFGKDAYLVPNAVNEKIFFPDKPLEPKSEKLRVLIEGPVIIPFKGVADAFKVTESLDCEVWYVSSHGRPDGKWRCDKFFEKVPQDEMRHIYSSCDVLLKLSRIEGFFGPPLEMMACGGTAVVGDVTGFDEYIVDERNALVVSLGDLKAAKNAIQKLIDDRSLLAKLKKGGLETARGMSWEDSTNLLEKFINKK